MKNNLQIGFILEVFWLVVCIASILKSINDTYHFGFSESYEFYILSILALLLYFLRRSLRKKNARS